MIEIKRHADIEGTSGDALGNPIRLPLTPGRASEYSQAEALLEGFVTTRIGNWLFILSFFLPIGFAWVRTLSNVTLVI